MNHLTSRLSTKKLWLLIAAVLIVAAGLMLVTLTKWSVWHDEGYSIMLSQYSVKELLRRTALDVHPPLYYLLLKSWAHLFGWSIISVRLMSVLFGLLAIAVAMLVCHSLFGKKPTLYLAPMLAVASVITRYAQEARMYTFAMVLCLVFVYAYIRLKQSSSLRKWGVVFVVSAVLLMYTHYFASLVLLVPIIGELWDAYSAKQGRIVLLGRVKRLAPLYAAIFVLFLPWLPKLLDQIHSVRNGFWIGPVTSSSIPSTLSSFVLFRPEWLNWRLSGWYAVAALMLVAVVYLLVGKVLRQKNEIGPSKLIVLSWALPITILFLMSGVAGMHYYFDRYFSSFAPFFFMTCALGLSLLSARRARWMGAVFAVMMMIGVYNAAIFGNNYGHTSGDEFSMKQLYGHIHQSPYVASKYVATDLGVYFDLRAYMVADGRNEPSMVLDKPTDTLGKYGNTSLIYDRQDILVKGIEELSALPSGSYVWYVTHTSMNPADKIPQTWNLVDSYQVGYARANLYRLP